MDEQGPGGFLLSPPLSSASTHSSVRLPASRSSPLRPGGKKESSFIRYADQQILNIQRRFAKRTTPDVNGDAIERDGAAIWDNVKGYTSMREACKDIRELVNILWISGTPGVQIPYLISIALLLTTIIPGMPPTPGPLFRLLELLDNAFASLLQGRDDNGEPLSGFDTGRGVSGTEKVRLRSLVERTRKCVVEVFRSPDLEVEEVDDADDGELVIEGDTDAEDDDEPGFEMQIARVYDRTIVELGDSLETPNIGIITE